MSNSYSDLPRKSCVSHGVIEMLMSLAVVAIMILSTCGVQIKQKSHAGCMNEPWCFECTISMLPSDTSCGEDIKVAAKLGCNASIFGSSFPLQAALRKPLFILELSTEQSAIMILMLDC